LTATAIGDISLVSLLWSTYWWNIAK